MNSKTSLGSAFDTVRSAARTSVILVTVAIVAGCATTNDKATNQEAIVCPECKMVAVKTSRQPGGYYPGLPGARWQAGPVSPSTTYDHRCPNCQGAITTMMREGKLKHKCSVCENAPFSCPVFHPTAKSN